MAMMKQRFSRYALAAAIAACSTGLAAQESLTVVSFGGAYGAAHQKHMIGPFEKDTGVKLLVDSYSGGIAEMKAQVESGRIQWDVISIEAIDLERACSEGLLETIDHSQLPPGIDGVPAAEDFIPEALASECAVATDVFAVIFAYNKNTIGANVPQSVNDIFDLQKIPGKRAFQKRPQVAMEWALMADGVPKEQVYEVLATDEGQARAFAKLDTIKKDIVWFDSWSQAPQLLNDGGAVIVQSPNGRIYDAISREDKPFSIAWDGNLYDLDVWSVLKGTPKKDLAMKFVSYATESKPLSGMADVAYGPTRKSSIPLLSAEKVANLPTSHLGEGIKADSEFWADYGEALGEKFNEWLLK